VRLLSKSQEAALVRRVRDAHAKLIKGVTGSDLPEVSVALGFLSGAGSRSSSMPTVWYVRSMIEKGKVPIDRAAADALRDQLTDIAQSVRDRLLSKVRLALREGSSLLRKRKLSARDLSKARRAALAIAKGQIEKALSVASREWRRDIGTTIHDAMEEGRASSIIKKSGTTTLVWKKTHPDCCSYCRLLYTVDGSRPRVFRIDQLMSNGSNVGRRAGRPTFKGENATEWLPVVGSVHVGCRCELRVVHVSEKGS